MLVKFGFFLVFFVFIVISVRLLLIGSAGSLGVSLFFILILFLIYMRLRLGFYIAKIVVGFLALLPVAGAFNPFTYAALSESRFKYFAIVGLAVFVECIFLLMFYGLQERQKNCHVEVKMRLKSLN